MLEISDILDNQVLGPYFKDGWEKGYEEGWAVGWEEGLEQGRQEGALRLLKSLISERFGILPPWAEEKLSESRDFDSLGKRFLEVDSLDELFS